MKGELYNSLANSPEANLHEGGVLVVLVMYTPQGVAEVVRSCVWDSCKEWGGHR